MRAHSTIAVHVDRTTERVNNSKKPSFLAQWISRHDRELRTYLTRRLGCRQTAADLAQETYLRLYSFTASTPGQHLPALAYSIANRLSIDHARIQRVRERYDDSSGLIDTVIDPAPNAEQVVTNRRTLEKVQSALDELPTACRTALMLSLLHWLTQAEIAAELKVSTRMVSKYLSRALRHCRDRALD